MSESGEKFPQYLATIYVCIAAMCIGTAIGWTSNITQDLKLGYLNDIDMTDVEIGWIGSLMNLGAMFMCLPAGYMVDMIGRRLTLIWSTIPLLIGWLLIVLVSEITLLYIGRFLIGVSSGSFSVLVPLYISEIAHSNIRGALGTFFQLFITIGILYCGILGFAMPFIPYITICFCVPIILVILMYFQVESPVYDLKKGRFEEAEKTFLKFRGEYFDFGDEIEEILKDFEQRKKLPFIKSFNTKATRKATIICLLLMFYQQLSGYYAVMFYSQEIFKDAGSTINHSYCVILLQSLQVIATSVSTLTVDRFGRKVLLILSAVFMTVSSGFLGLFFSVKDRHILMEDSINAMGFMPAVFLSVFIIAHSIAFGPIPWIAASEFFSPAIKPKCNALVATVNWFLAFGVTKLYFPLAYNLGTDVTFYIFCFISFSATFFVYIVMPETRGKTFAEIQELLEGSIT